MTQYQILYWRDIPTQVRVLTGRRPLLRELPCRFQMEIDRIAMREGLVASDEYLDHWQWTEKREREGSPEELLEALVEELVSEYDNR
ncbi:MAG: virulence factor [Candidatus Latescibacterota bacterium]|nr:virulence factor [Candidatus Latescibacterota bacterium]